MSKGAAKKKARQRAQERDQKRNKSRKIFWVSAPIALIAALVLGFHLYSFRGIAAPAATQMSSILDPDAPRIDPSLIPQLAALKEYVFSENGRDKINANLQKNASHYKRDDFIVFLSVCGGQDRADVVKGIGKTLAEAWTQAETKAAEFIAGKKYDVVWAKADIVNTAKEISSRALSMEISKAKYLYFYRKGIALDRNFNTAFLEAEINGNNFLTYRWTKLNRFLNSINSILFYRPAVLDLNSINTYLKNHYGYKGLSAVPGRVTVFTTIGFMCDEGYNIYDLYTNGMDYGRRVIDTVDAEYIEPLIINAAHYLHRQLQPDGAFIYGNYPVFDQELRSYNILRHAGSVWSLINLYRMTGDEELVPPIDAAIHFVLEENIQYKDANTAYVVERKTDEAKLGGNGITIVMLTEYMDVFKTDKYIDIVKLLANGILELQDRKGHYYHVLNYPGWSRKEEFRTVYYDGEATFALARTYTWTHEQKYLDAAVRAVENFINKNYEKYTDHWVSYSLNEVTMYVPEPRYYEFALSNVQKNLKKIYNYPRSFQTSLELLMAGWQTYERLLESGISIRYPRGFTAERFAETIYKRAFHLLNDYFYPEYAMYMQSPYKIADTFFQRNDQYRIRIDDVQHFIGGYYNYFLHYEKIRPHLSHEFIDRINKGNIVN